MLMMILYALVLVGYGVMTCKASGSVDAYTVADRSGSWFSVAVSVTASCVGGSATIGMVSLAWEKGFPAIWYLGSGAAGLVLLTLFLAKKVRETGVRTLPEMIRTFIGPGARPVAGVIIVIAWTSILAAQFSAASSICAALTGLDRFQALVWGGGLIIVYTVLGGQRSVIKSDIWQFGLVVLALAGVLGWIMLRHPDAVTGIRPELFNRDFTISTWNYYMLVIGGSYVVCPMLFGRLLSAKDKVHAHRGTLAAVFGLLATGLVIVLIGLAGRAILPADTAPDAVLTSAMAGLLPPWLGTLLLLALFSAIISSADSCLITAATVFCNDIARQKSVRGYRIMTVILGLAGLYLGSRGSSILSLLFAANDVYVSGIVAPVFLAMVFHGRRRVYQPAVLAGMIAGGLLGLAAAQTGIKTLSFAGMAVSAVLTLAGLWLPGKRPVPPELRTGY